MNSGDSRSALRGPPKLLQLRQVAVKWAQMRRKWEDVTLENITEKLEGKRNPQLPALFQLLSI